MRIINESMVVFISMDQINEQHLHRGDWLREIVFGLNDGLVTTLVFIMAVREVAPGDYC